MKISFITTKDGNLTSISVHKYRFRDTYIKNAEKRQKFINWLYKNPNIYVYDIKGNFFFLFEPLEEAQNNQYLHLKSTIIDAPFENPSQISGYIGKIVRDCLSKDYKRFLNQNIFVIETVIFEYFSLKKGVEFNIEVFRDGRFYIHFLPISKIVSYKVMSLELANTLKSKALLENITDLEFNIVSLSSFKTVKCKFSDEENWQYIEKIIQEDKFVGTFDYHFLTSFSPNIFAQIIKNTIKLLPESLEFLNSVISKIDAPDWLGTSKKSFFRIETQNLANDSNLLIGGGKFSCKEQKAAYYNGVYIPVNNKVILPIGCGSIGEDYLIMFKELFLAFNKGGVDVTILTQLNMEAESNTFIQNIKLLRQKYGRDFIVIIFTQYSLPKKYLNPIQKLNIQIQTYLGKAEKFQMSNFVVKCIEKLGGVLSVIKNTFEPPTTYFIGADLGHSTSKKEKYSNLGMVLFDYKGILLKTYVIKNIKRNEALTEDVIRKILTFFFDYLQEVKLPLPNKIIFHRDGKLHKTDLEIIIQKITELFDVFDIDIVEIIKSGYPVLAKYDVVTKQYLNVASGECWCDQNYKYAILATNIQTDEKGTLINPIIIKHKYGNTNFYNIVYQVYWFTKMYTNNLYNSTRLPATTLKANNIVSTSDKVRVSSNLG